MTNDIQYRDTISKRTIDAIIAERIREELGKIESLERQKQIAKDIANSDYSQEELNITDYRAEVENMSNATSKPHKELKAASVQGLINATNDLIKEMADKSYHKEVVKALKATVAQIIIDNVNDSSISLYVDSKGNYKAEKAYRLVVRKAHKSDFCKLLSDLKNESHAVNTSPMINESEKDNTDYLQNRQDLNSNKEFKNIRLKKVATELNVGIQTIVQFLAQKGHHVEANPNTRIIKQQYDLLLSEFKNEKKVPVDIEGGNNPKPLSKNAKKKERKRTERRATIASRLLKN